MKSNLEVTTWPSYCKSWAHATVWHRLKSQTKCVGCHITATYSVTLNFYSQVELFCVAKKPQYIDALRCIVACRYAIKLSHAQLCFTYVGNVYCRTDMKHQHPLICTVQLGCSNLSDNRWTAQQSAQSVLCNIHHVGTPAPVEYTLLKIWTINQFSLFIDVA